MFARFNLFSILTRIERKIDTIMITQVQFDTDLKPVTDAIPVVISALEAQSAAKDATIASLTAQLAAAGTPPPAPDFTAEDAAVVAAKAELDAALATTVAPIAPPVTPAS